MTEPTPEQSLDNLVLKDDSGEIKDQPLPSTTPTVRDAEIILEEARRCIGGWSEDIKRRLLDLEEEFLRDYLDRKGEMDEIKKLDSKFSSITKNAKKVGGGSTKVPPLRELQAIAEKDFLEYPKLYQKLIKEIDRAFEMGRIALERAKRDYLKRKSSGQYHPKVTPRSNQAVPLKMPTSSPNSWPSLPPTPVGMYPNDIRALTPSADWIFLLDETGDNFGGPSSKPGKLGKFVGLLTRENNPGLPPLPKGWHAVHLVEPEKIDIVFQTILNASCGIIGLTLNALPDTKDERWLDGMLTLVDWVLRLLPLDGPTRIRVLIEGRPPYPPKLKAEAVARSAKKNLARTWPERAQKIRLKIETISKDDHPLNGYVDALAFTWGSTLDSSKERLKVSGLKGTCFLQIEARDMIAFWEAWDRPGGIQPDEWTKLVSSSDAMAEAGLLNTLLNALAEECKKEPNRWLPYLEETRSHLSSKAINLRRLAAQVGWLQKAMPDFLTLPAALRLAWLTAQLAQANHVGKTELSWQKELGDLSEKLFNEDAPLVCYSDLHVAVNATNRFDFENAMKQMEHWKDVPMAVPGRRFWGQIQSLIGQCHAFMNKNKEAIDCFDLALLAFSELSEKSVAEKESSQTLCYRIIAEMDNPDTFDSKLNESWDEYFKLLGIPSPLLGAVTTLAESSDDKYKYAHHLLLRQLVFKGDTLTWEIYRKKKEFWKRGEGHPWPLIQLYRAVLIYPEDENLAKDLAIEAAGIAFFSDMGPTVNLIGAVCRSVAVAYGAPWDEAEIVLNELKSFIPMAKERIELLGEWILQPDPDPRLIIKEVLPFNFR